jgi:hypothetical protein
MDISLIIAGLVIFVLPALIVVIASIFPPKLDMDTFASPRDWGSQDIDQNLNK